MITFRNIRKRSKYIASFFALNMMLEIIVPMKAWALTGGPSQPESSSFEPVGTTEMVDLFSGDFTYNIPLFDVGGYPVNISYHGGVSMDQEASWVGLGWNINPGAINRGMRGIPDDFLDDKVTKDMHIKANNTWGLKLNVSAEIFGWGGKGGAKGKGAKFNSWKGGTGNQSGNNNATISLGLGVVHNNYKGIGYSLDIGASASNSSKAKGDLPAGGLSYSLNSQEGSSWGMNASISHREGNYRSITPSIGLGYNSYMGMSSFDVGLSASRAKNGKNTINKSKSENGGLSSYLPIGTYSYVPNINIPTLSTSNSGSFTIGLDGFGAHPHFRLSGFYNTEELESSQKKVGAYGYLYEQESYWKRGADDIMLDFNREKESSVNKKMTHLPLTNHTYDIYSVSGQGTGGMYRPHRKTIGIMHDGYSRNRNKTGGMNEIGVELGFGVNFHWGASYKTKVQRSSTGLWGGKDNAQDNGLLRYMNYRMNETENWWANKKFKQTYFKAAGEQTPSDNYLGESWGGKKEIALKIDKTGAGSRNLRFGKVFQYAEGSDELLRSYTDDNPVRSNCISYLNAAECQNGFGMDNRFLNYPLNYWTNLIKNGNYRQVIPFTDRHGGANGAKAHHISEIISNSGDGMRYVYGLPAYNSQQKEATFAVSRDMVSHPGQTPRNEMPAKGLVEYGDGDNSVNNERGVDNYYMATNMPAYAHSYLLTAVLSPDYADILGDGITDDDYGSAVKFNYYKVPNFYGWRTPYEANTASLDEGYISDNSDNKGSFIYGQKEIWYLQSMESKTHIAEFKLSPRKDGHGVANENGGLSTATNNTMLKLDSIVIYSKYDILINGKNAVPVKTIVFQYDYSLCQGVPNNENGLGKLTLKSIYFTYGNSGKGALNPYRFTYSNSNPKYSHVHYDRWGNYKFADESLPNRYFPYVDRDIERDTLDKFASAWNLTQIELPSGGKINVEYEADDYAYVQNRKAMQMFKILASSEKDDNEYKKSVLPYTDKEKKYGISGQKVPQRMLLYDDSKNYNYLYFKFDPDVPDIPSGKDAKRIYLLENFLKDEEGNYMEDVYFRFKVNIDPGASKMNDFEYVSGYAEIDRDHCGITDDNEFGYIKIKEVKQGDLGSKKCNPIAKQSWQMGLQNLRKVIFPGSDQSQADDDGQKQSAMLGLKSAFSTSLDIFKGPYQTLRKKEVARYFESNRSFIRLYNQNGFKVGGGCRVKKITIDDNWNNMNSGQQSGQYGQEFSYVTKTNIEANTGKVISSGVASYEPFVGNDENPFRRPVFYRINRAMFPDLSEYQEEPFGESFFPSASVGYSRVVVRNIPKPGTIATSTGKVVHEFYTAKDFPVITSATGLKIMTNGKGFWKALSQLFNVVKRDYLVASQGYSVILNDMHGKPKSTAIYSSLGEEEGEEQFTGILISGTEYKYKTETTPELDSFANVFPRNDTLRFRPVPKGSRLYNKVWVMKENGQLYEREIATSYDIAVDTRESKSHYRHAGLDFNTENFYLAFVPCPYPKYLVNQNMYQGAVVTKVIQQYGVLDETIAYDHSSIVKTKNLVWDEQTGQVLLTATSNEFDDPIYNYTYPAHLAYPGMGPAYKNMDYETTFIIGDGGFVDTTYLSSEDQGQFVEGDELIMHKGFDDWRGWVLKAETDTATGKYSRLQFINRYGGAITPGTWQVKIIRSGRRNLSATPVGAITTMDRAIFSNGSNNNRLVLNQKIVQSSAAKFSDEWQGFMDKAAYEEMLCVDDSLKITFEDYCGLIKSILISDSAEDYLYGGSAPPQYNTLASYTPLLKRKVDNAFKNSFVTHSTCSPNTPIVGDQYFAGNTTGSINNMLFHFTAKYKCDPEASWSTEHITCELLLTVDSQYVSVLSLDSISNFNQTSETTGTAVGYRDDSTFSVSFQFANSCFSAKKCYFVYKCDYRLGRTINPFVNNLKGVWRQKEAFAFNSTRAYEVRNYNNTNIRKDGLIENYAPFWIYNSNLAKNGIDVNTGTNSNKWVSTGQATLYAPHGNGLEEKDALGIYSSQLFGYQNTLVTAQASNAMHRQIAFDNFEDYLTIDIGCSRQEGHFNFKKGMHLPYTENYIGNPFNHAPKFFYVSPSDTVCLARDTAHTGIYSLCVKANRAHAVMRKIDFSGISIDIENDSLFSIHDMDKVITPFAPTPGKYVLSAWVNENHADHNTINNYQNALVNIKVYNGGSAVVNQNFSASGVVIDEWQRIDGTFTIPVGADSIKVTLVNTGSVSAFFDDIRLHPFDSKMVGHVYHAIHLKVMAELDENNYATFYEYDDEGSLIRVKRETEKGIVTVQESRKSIKKNSN